MAVIRLAATEDLPFLPEIEAEAARRLKDIGMTTLYEQFAPYVTSVETFAAYLAAGRLRVAIEDGRPVGFIMVSKIDDHAHIDEVDVLPDYGRRGIGRALMDRACNWAKAQGLITVTLSTQANVPWNQPYYEKLGFEIMPPAEWTPAYQKIQQIEIDAGFPMQDRVLMKKVF
jgi:ribosomal protein S18 acetylase RimI-like enzyme